MQFHSLVNHQFVWHLAGQIVSQTDRQRLSHLMILCWQVEKFEPWSGCAGSSPTIWRVAEIIRFAVSSSLLLLLMLLLLSADTGRSLEVLAAIDPLFSHGNFTAGTRGDAAPINTPLLIDGTCASYKGHSTLNQYLHHGTCDGQRSLDESYGRSGLYPAGEDPGDGPFALTRKTPYPHGSFRAGTLTAPARPSTSGCGQALRRQSKQHICKNEYCMSVGLSQCSSTRSPFLHNTNLHPTRTPTIYTTLV